MEIPIPKAEHLGRTFFTDPPKEIAWAVSVPPEFRDLIDFSKKHFGIEEQVPAAITFVKHTGTFNLKPGSLGTALRLVYHLGPRSNYEATAVKIEDQEHEIEFTLTDKEGFLMKTEQTQKTKLFITSETDEMRYLIILDFGYLLAKKNQMVKKG